MSDAKTRRSRGMGSVYLRGKTFWLKYYVPVPGGRAQIVYESAHTPKRDVAEKLLRRKLAKVDAAKERGEAIGPNVDRTTIGDIANLALLKWREKGKLTQKKWQTVDGGERRYVKVPAKRHYPLDTVATYFGARRVDDPVTGLTDRYEGGRLIASITNADIVRFKLARQEAGTAPATVNRSLAALKFAFRRGIKERCVAFVPEIELLAENNVREVDVEQAEFKQLSANLADSPDVRDIVEFAYLTGWRREAGMTLEWSDVFADSIRLRAEHSKTGVAQDLELRGELAELIARRRELRRLDCRYVFHIDGQPIESFRGRWRKACKAAGLGEKTVRFHDLRHVAVNEMIDANIPESVVMKITGHATRSMLDRYHTVSKKRTGDALEARDAHRAEKLATASGRCHLCAGKRAAQIFRRARDRHPRPSFSWRPFWCTKLG